MHLFEFGIGQLSWVECKDGGNVWAPSYPKSSKMMMMSMSGLPLIPDLHCPIDTISLTSQPVRCKKEKSGLFRVGTSTSTSTSRRI